MSTRVDRTNDIKWRTDGAFEIGEGLHDVNTAKHPAWLVVREVPDHNLTIAHMVWQQDASLERVRRTIMKSYASFRPGGRPEEYLAIARDRPAKLQAARDSALKAALDGRGVMLSLDMGPVVHDGVVYELHTDERLGRLLTVLYPLGALPRAAAYRHLRPPVKGIPNLTDVLWFGKDAEGWKRGAVGSDLLLSTAITAFVGSLHERDADRAHFYAADLHLLDDADMPAPDLDGFERAGKAMAPLLSEGRLVQ